MNSIKLYYHNGSRNHGCEAIVRATHKIVNRPLILYSRSPNEDIEYGLNDIVKVEHDKDTGVTKKSLKYFMSAFYIKAFNSTLRSTKYSKSIMLNEAKKGDLWFSIGGDNYCYGSHPELADLNRLIHQKGAKTVLWGCSIEPQIIHDHDIRDFARYDLITARETITYNALKEAGVVDNLELYPDPAFQLDKVELPLPDKFDKDNTVGINISPLAIGYEKKSGLTMDNFVTLIHHIIDKTDCQIALIPHVVKDHNDDKVPLSVLYNRFKASGRVVMFDDYNCMELKGFISSCRFFIGARTHSTIAAYSTCVPTLALGYSVKAKGISKDIFGTYENYVVPVQGLKNKFDLTNYFEWMKSNESQIRDHLKVTIPDYCARAMGAGEAIGRIK